MIRLTQAIAAVMACTVASGVAGGVVGVAIGTFAPSFVLWLQELPPGRAAFNPSEIGLGLGTVTGLFFGAAVGSFLVAVISLRDAWLARAGLSPDDFRPASKKTAGMI